MKKILILFFLIIISCNNEKNTYDKTPLENINSTKLFHDGLLREYVLHVPQLYDGETPLPLVLNFHGFGDSATSHSLLTGMIPVANENNFIIALLALFGILSILWVNVSNQNLFHPYLSIVLGTTVLFSLGLFASKVLVGK